ncbi:hypothetical protein, partial [Heyndrickxia coagulans]|uniref:hypothetical protein n=1 Tax=Heyndrickxia coagulans TaxID=1398 RepID=UPI002E1FFB06|nr:hypothetical protein [Heyndrickxia coagulans]
ENNKKKNPNRHPEYDHTGLKAGFPWPAMEIKSRVFIAKLKCRDVQNFYANGYAEGLYMEG